MLTRKQIGIFGASHVQRLHLSENITVLGKGGERARNWHSHTAELRVYDITVLMIGGNDIYPRDIFTPADMTLRDLTLEIRELYNFGQQHNSVVVTADMVQRLNKPEEIRKMNNRLINKYKKKHIQFAEVVGNDFSDVVHSAHMSF